MVATNRSLVRLAIGRGSSSAASRQNASHLGSYDNITKGRPAEIEKIAPCKRSATTRSRQENAASISRGVCGDTTTALPSHSRASRSASGESCERSKVRKAIVPPRRSEARRKASLTWPTHCMSPQGRRAAPISGLRRSLGIALACPLAHSAAGSSRNDASAVTSISRRTPHCSSSSRLARSRTVIQRAASASRRTSARDIRLLNGPIPCANSIVGTPRRRARRRTNR